MNCKTFCGKNYLIAQCTQSTSLLLTVKFKWLCIQSLFSVIVTHLFRNLTQWKFPNFLKTTCLHDSFLHVPPINKNVSSWKYYEIYIKFHIQHVSFIFKPVLTGSYIKETWNDIKKEKELQKPIILKHTVYTQYLPACITYN